MKVNLFLVVILSLLSACGIPKGSVFEDKRLAQEAEVKFCLLGDLGRETPHQEEMAQALEREDCDRIFFLGDLVYPKGVESLKGEDLQKKFLKYYQPLLERDPGLIIALVLGNHDHKGDPSVWRDLAKSNPGFFFPYYYYLVDYGGLCVVGLDTSFYYYTEKVAEAAQQTTWLQRLQPRLKDCEVKVAITHHPLKGDDHPGSMDWNGASGPLKAFLEAYVIGKFDMHISGHVHILHDDGKDEGTRLLISGTGGEVLGGGKAGFVILRWDPRNPKQLMYSLKEVDLQVSINEEQPGAMRQEAFEEGEAEHVINKSRVETTLFHKIWDGARNFF